MNLTPQEKGRLAALCLSPSIGFRDAKTVLGQLNKVQDKTLIHKLVIDGVRAIREENLEIEQPIDCHFFYMHALNFYYRHRDEDKGLDNAKFFCIQQIKLAEKSIPAFKSERFDPLPSHTGYEKLCIIWQKERRYEAAIQLCEQARMQGWAGDWEKRYARAENSIQSDSRVRV